MKFLKNSIYFFCQLSILSIAVINNGYALQNDRDQPINITSDEQSMDLQKDIVVFSKNVVVTQGSMILKANTVKITKNSNKQEIIHAYGNPVTFYQKLDDGKPVNGQAKQFIYDTQSNLLTLLQSAKLKQLDSQIMADQITYDTKEKKISATSNKNNRIKTILIPQQLNSK